ncbi:MAG: hypothetical protein HY558_00685 [Euryarchaeota archaeon]|nr:hypothetical protein [Euryarchaeota archaeon]
MEARTMTGKIVLTGALRGVFLVLALGLAAGSAQAGPTLADMWAGNAYFERQSYSADSSVHEVFPIQVGPSTIYLYYRTYVGQPSDGGAIGLAISTDGGKTYSLYNGGKPLVAPGGSTCDWDSRYVISPGVVKVGSTFYMVYEGRSRGYPFCGSPGEIGLATSTDGLNWVKRGIIVGKGGGFESANIGTPFIGYFKNQFYVFYHGFDNFRSKVGMAYGSNIYALTKNPGPVMDVGKGKYAWDSYVNTHVSIVQEGSYYYMAYEGSQDPYCDKGNWGWGIARSTDLKNWEKYSFNPIRHTYQGGCGNDLPSIFRFSGETYVYQREPGQRNILKTGRDPYLYVWQAEVQCAAYHQTGKLDGAGWSANTAQHGRGYMCYGPYVTLPEGRYTVQFRQMVDVVNAWNDRVATQDIYDATTRSLVRLTDIYRKDFAEPWKQQNFAWQLPASAGHAYEFRTYWHDTSYVNQDIIIARRL